MDERIPGIISSIFLGETYYFPIRTSANLRLNKTSELGIPYVQLFDNPNLLIRDIILERLQDEEQFLGETLVIDENVLNDSELMNAIREKALKQGRTFVIRISTPGHVLTREEYDRLSFVGQIAVDAVAPGLENERGILLEYGVFKYDHQATAQPVLERSSQFNELISRNTFHVDHPLSDQEFEYLIFFVNAMDNASIELDYFNPDYYEEFLEQLQRHNIKTDVNIQLIGYLLKDRLNVFERLEKFPYEIDVVYSTCHDIVDMYTKEPFTSNRMYYSQIEGGGKTSLGNYLNVLEEVTNFEAMARRGNYSPLEIAILAK